MLTLSDFFFYYHQYWLINQPAKTRIPTTNHRRMRMMTMRMMVTGKMNYLRKTNWNIHVMMPATWTNDIWMHRTNRQTRLARLRVRTQRIHIRTRCWKAKMMMKQMMWLPEWILSQPTETPSILIWVTWIMVARANHRYIIARIQTYLFVVCLFFLLSRELQTNRCMQRLWISYRTVDTENYVDNSIWIQVIDKFGMNLQWNCAKMTNTYLPHWPWLNEHWNMEWNQIQNT